MPMKAFTKPKLTVPEAVSEVIAARNQLPDQLITPEHSSLAQQHQARCHPWVEA